MKHKPNEMARCVREREGDRWHAARPSHICILSSPAEAYPALRSLARRATEGEECREGAHGKG